MSASPPTSQADRRRCRLATLAEVAELAMADEDGFSFGLRDFLDGFYAAPTPSALAAEPARLEPGKDAYLAAVADHLSRGQGWPAPLWARHPSRTLPLPKFFAESHALRMLLLMDSPAAFRERNLFVSADALSRA